MPVDLELWNKLNDFRFDDPRAAFRFTDRVARENGWSKAFARRAVDEYKKFVYLAATSETPVTPSDIVDQVWHLHLTFTRSYWDDMCANVLGHPLHHGPTKGGAGEDAKYRNQYAGTLALYRIEFGNEPPLEFWPHADARFAAASHQRWVDARTHFVIRKPKLSALWAGTAVAVWGVSAAGTAAAADGATGAERTTTLLVIGGVAATVLVLFGALFAGGSRSGKRRGRDKGDSSDTSSAFIASTSGGGGSKNKGEGGEGGEGAEGGGDGGSGCGGGCGSS